MTMFRVGMLVVYLGLPVLRISRDARKFGVILPSKGRVYTIRDLDTRFPSGLGIRVEEIVNPTVPNTFGYAEAAFHPRQFRPVATTDISWAHKLVADLPKSKTLIDS